MEACAVHQDFSTCLILFNLSKVSVILYTLSPKLSELAGMSDTFLDDI
jgi:hypothetical protein